MTVPPEIFDEDYDYFYSAVIDAGHSDADAELAVRLLSLHPGMRVLDVPCGDGRIAARLARHGCRVVGIDRERRFVERARNRDPASTYELGDMRALCYEKEFDAVVNWFTSFGYDDPETNDRLLAGFARALAPGGKLLLELHNPWHLAALLNVSGGSTGIVLERDGNLMADRVGYDEQSRMSQTNRFLVRDGRVRKVGFSLEQIPPPQLISRLRQAGFGSVELFGRGGAEFDPTGPRLIVVAGLEAAPTPRVSLREVDTDNVRAICSLKLAPGQERYVAPAAYTLADASVYPNGWVRAIYADESPVGLLALIVHSDMPHLGRFMIGAQHQGQGLGRAAIELLVDHVRTLPGAVGLETSCAPEPEGPIGFYLAAGFEDIGRIEHGEAVLRLML